MALAVTGSRDFVGRKKKGEKCINYSSLIEDEMGLIPEICVQEVAVFHKTCDFISQMSKSCFNLCF